jgi:hypothetical protein
MPINRPVIDDRKYRVLLATIVVTFVFAAATFLLPDVIPPAIYLYMPGGSSLRDASIPTFRTIINGATVFIVTIVIFAIDSIREKGKGS